MWDNATITMLLEGTRDTLYMHLCPLFSDMYLACRWESSSQ